MRSDSSELMLPLMLMPLPLAASGGRSGRRSGVTTHGNSAERARVTTLENGAQTAPRRTCAGRGRRKIRGKGRDSEDEVDEQDETDEVGLPSL